LQHKRDRPIVTKLTQQELLAEAAITEEQNKDSLLEWQQKEAERKENAKKKDKKGITGPFVRYHSFVDGLYDSQMHAEEQEEKEETDGNTETENTTMDGKSAVTAEEEQEQGQVSNMDLDATTTQLMGRNLITFVEYPNGEQNQDLLQTSDNNLELVDLVDQLSSWLEKAPKPNKPILCPITGELAKYRDPHTNVPYANIQAYNTIKACLYHEMNWSSSNGLYLGNLPSADGVPEGWDSLMN
jgi:vacuolar protein sorting-associated protein 72